MAMINVNRQTNDMFYRYKMPKLIAKVEGTGNGIKTVLVNVSAVARALDRPPSYITKFFGCELGAQTQMYPKEDKYIVNGAHDCEKLLNLLDSFIKRFVLCPKCENPETKLSVHQRNGGEIHQACKACGHKGTIAMTSHRVTTYIAKNPPDTDPKAKASTESKGKVKSKKTEGSTNNRDQNNGSPTGQNGETNGASKSGDDDDDEDWGDDDATQVRQPLDLQIKGMIQTDDLEKPVEERCNQFQAFVEDKKKEEKLKDLQCVKEIVAEANRLEINERAPFLVAQVIFTENIIKEADDYKLLLSKICFKNPKGQRYLLNALETLCFQQEDIRQKIMNAKAIARLLMKFYENDIVEEETFYGWHEKPMKRFSSKDFAKKIRELSNDFVEWLRTAEESSDEENGNDTNGLPEPDIDFSHTATNGLEVKIEPVRKAPVEEKIEFNGEVFNVDEI